MLAELEREDLAAAAPPGFVYDQTRDLFVRKVAIARAPRIKWTPYVFVLVPGPPRGKGRPRTDPRTGHVYTDEKTRSYESQVKGCAHDAMVNAELDPIPKGTMVAVRVTARLEVPSSETKAYQRLAAAGLVRPFGRFDADNILKVVDGLNGIVWHDDRQVVDATVRKVFAASPSLVIEVATG